jgi:RNA polymerase sigma-70 factor, ECF subfamily
LDEVRLAIRGSEDRLGWERVCLEKIRRGDRQGFAEIYAEYAPSIRAQVLLPRLGSPAAAEEALAETFRAALERLGEFRPQGGGLFAWLARIAMNKATDLHRERARTGKALASFEALIAPLRDEEPSVDFDRGLDQARLRAAIEQVLAEVSPRYRRAIELRMLEDLPRAECATRMEIAIGNFDVLLLRALRAFRAAWIARHGMEER